MKNQKGFTLIELMVVIVIIGILSAVALPKMFGMSAKAKAAEIKPAMVQFERLHTAYFMENPTDAGANASAAEIGWQDPANSKTFTWDATTAGSLEAAVPANTSLNECAAGSTFTTTVSVSASGALQSTHTLSDAANCGTLVTGWERTTAAAI